MKSRFLLLSFLSCLLCFTYTARAAETEPNNTSATANVLPLNGSNSGAITASDVDWYQVTLTGDGAITYTLTETFGQNATARLYDANGTTELGYAEVVNGSVSKTVDGLAAGTYYIKIAAYYNGQTPVYSISNTLAVPTQANDAEPNGTRVQAITLPVNNSKTGHIGYLYNNQRDTSDWYKITTTNDGLIKLNLTSANGNFVTGRLYDADGTTQLGYLEVANGTNATSVDGLAAGTYYVQIKAYYSNQFVPYVITDSLFTTVANDPEPNGTVPQAVTLAVNGSATGHIGYYNNNRRDTLDWYKITTTNDGLIKLNLTSANGNFVSARLFDANGTTQLGYVEVANNTSATSVDGLAAGTYYIQIKAYYSNQFVPYVITDSLFTTVANDPEPNGTIATAKPLAVNGSTTGHIGYYNNNQRDTLDWYKIVTPKNGAIKLKITSGNGNYVSARLYNEAGNLQLNYVEAANGTATVTTDGLGAGTYYVKINSYYSNQFVPYTLADSLFTYNPNDTVPNKYFSQAPTIPANRTVTGDVGFLFNTVRDTADTWKINYTGTNGNLNLTFALSPHIGDGGISYLWFQVYKDTAATPIFSNNYAAASTQINLTGLTQGYYYIKVFAYYNNQFNAYSITDNFTQVNIAAAAVKSTRPNLTACAGNSLTFTLTQSHSPYGVQLYRNGVRYDSSNVAGDTARFDNLPAGIYYATVYGDGATDAAYGTSGNTTFLPPTPAGLNTTNILVHTAKLNWTPFSCVKSYRVQYKLSTANTWTTLDDANDAVGTYTLTGLMMYTNYTWRVASVDTAQSTVLVGNYSDTLQFKTLSDTAIITRTKFTQGATCNSSSSSIRYTSTHSVDPYTVQLYRNGAAYGNPVSSTDTTLFTSLPAGIYYATSSGTGSGGSFGTSGKDTILPPAPTGLSTSNITLTSAKLNWTPLSCESNYRLQYRLSTATAWTTLDDANDAVGTYTITSLTAYTNYTWRVASVDTAQSAVLASAYSDTLQFRTLSDTARIVRSSKTNGTACNSSTLTYTLSNSVAPYTVQLYRYGTAYGSSAQATGTATFSNLPTGIYYATATGAGSGGSFGTSGIDTLMPPVPAGLDTIMVTAVSAQVEWTPLSCASYFSIQYRPASATTWTTIQTEGNVSTDSILGLTPATLYVWRLAAVDTTAGTMLMSVYSGNDTFMTMQVLPVTLISFTAKPVNNTVQLSWQTANEINSSYYAIQRSADGITFSTVGTIQAGSQHQYSFIDNSPAKGNNYYRLRQVDKDGHYTDSKIVIIGFTGTSLFTLYPNPAVNVVHVNLYAQGKGTLTVYDNNSKAVLQKVVSDGTTSQQLTVSGLAAGTYMVVLQQADGSRQSIRFVKQ